MLTGAAEPARAARARREIVDDGERRLNDRHDHELRQPVERLQRERSGPRFQQLTISGPW